MRINFTIRAHKLFAVLALLSMLLAAELGKAQTPFLPEKTYYVDGIGVDLVAPKDTFISLRGSGAAYTGGTYSSTTGLFNALSVNGIDSNFLGTVTILLVPGYTGVETNMPILRGIPYSSPSRPIVLKPYQGANYTITRNTPLNVNEAVIRLEGVQFFTIDGEGTTGERNLSFVVPAGSTYINQHRVVDIVTTPDNVVSTNNYITVKNCNITGVNSQTSAGVLIGSSQGLSIAPTSRTENCSIINCDIQKVQNGIYAKGIMSASAAMQDKGLILRNNIIGGASNSFIGSDVSSSPIQAGIFISNQANTVIEGNTISNCAPESPGYAGIMLYSPSGTNSVDSNIYINANKIYNLHLNHGGDGVYGIKINHTAFHAQRLAIRITNNVISNISSQVTNVPSIASSKYPIGISIEENTPNAGIDIYNNSIALSGAYLNGGYSSCIYVSATTAKGIQLVNNILSNRMENKYLNSASYHVSAIIVNSSSTPFDDINNNIYDVSTSAGWAHIGITPDVKYASLNEWAIYTKNDQYSLTVVPVFSNLLTLLTSDGAGATYGNKGRSLLSNDINGNLRLTGLNSIGAYQFNQDVTIANRPLKAGETYYINGSSNYPVSTSNGGSFRNLTDFVTYLNSYGIDESTGGQGINVNVVIQEGYNTQGGDTSVIPAIRPYPGMNSARKIVLTVEAGIKAIVKLDNGKTIVGNSALFRLYGVQDFTIDGRGADGSRNITFQLPSSANSTTAKVFILAATANSPVSRNSIIGCNFLGSTTLTTSSSSIFTQAGIYVGDPFHVDGLGSSIGGNNDFNLISNNFIGGVRNGIYWRSKAGIIDNGNNIYRNYIGGEADTVNSRTNYIGGALNQAGIYVKGFGNNSSIDSNVVKNSLSSADGFRGIDLASTTEGGTSSNLRVTRNTIYNIGGVSYAVGIKVGLNEANLNIRIYNNFIARVYGLGSTSFVTLNSPAGIAFDNVPANTNIGATVAHNTIHLSQTEVDVITGGFTTAVFIGSGHTGITMRNNILSNTSGRKIPAYPGSNTVSLAFASTNISNTFNLTATYGNVFYANGRNSVNYIGLRGSNTFNQIMSIQDLFDLMGLDDGIRSAYGEVPFINDTAITLDPTYIGHIANNKLITYDGLVDFDIAGVSRGNATTSIGALHITPIYVPLQGGVTYHVNGVQQPPTTGVPSGEFSTINNLFRYLNTNGVDDNTFPIQEITILIGPGYAGEGDTIITPLHEYPKMSFYRKITIKPAPGASPVISSTALSDNTIYGITSSVIKFKGVQYITIDGSNNGTESRDLTIRMPYDNNGADTLRIRNPYTRVIDVMGWGRPASNITIKNCNIIGTSTANAIYTYAGIYQGGINYALLNIQINPIPNLIIDPVRTGNNDNVYRNNYITGVNYGIQLRGRSGVADGHDVNTVVAQNTIGGNINIGNAVPTDYFGGRDHAAGIFAIAQSKLLIDSNVINNNLTEFAFVSGIELTGLLPASSINSEVTISRNIIRNLRSSFGGSVGINTNIHWGNKRSFHIVNNMISALSSAGLVDDAGKYPQLHNNTYGIYLDGTAAAPVYTAIDLNVYNNSINLGGNGDFIGPNSLSACIALGSATRGEIKIENNILQNKLTRTTAGFPIYAIYSLASSASGNPISVTDNNNYYVKGANSLNHIVGFNNSGNVVNYTTLPNWSAFTKRDTLSMSFPAPFTSDIDLFIPDGSASPLYRAGRSISTVTKDILGVTRPTAAVTIGAHEFNGIYADSSAPKIYDYTKNFECQNPLNPLPIRVVSRVYDRNITFDTLYYRLNGSSTETSLLPSVVDGFERVYEIPPLPDNTLIAYRFASQDASGKDGAFVNASSTGLNYTTTTINTFPISTGFDLPNIYAWQTQQVSGNVGWNLESFGSQSNPFLFPHSGVKAAILPATPAGGATNVSRIVSPCLDLNNLVVPTLRLYVSQNYDGNINKDKINDSIVVKVLYGTLAVDISNAKPISRVNPTFGTPGYKVYDICLPKFAQIRLGIEGYSKPGGGAMLIDSIVLFDDFIDHDLFPAEQHGCFSDSFNVAVIGSSPQNEYFLFDELTQQVVGPRIKGNGDTLNLQGYMPSSDSAYIKAAYVNTTSDCAVPIGYLTKISKIRFGRFLGGPFVKAGSQFYGMFNAGTANQPDAVRIKGDADYEITPPSGRLNTDYGSTWTIAQVELMNIANNQLNNSKLTIIPPAQGMPAIVRFKGDSVDANKLFRMSIRLRLLPDGCDSVITRIVRVAAPPQVSFYAYNDTLCQGQSVHFQNVTTNDVYTLPVTYMWDFGDGTTSTSFAPFKSYTSPGNYTVTLKARNNSTLMDSLTFVFTVNTSPIASFTSTLACVGKQIFYTNTSTVGAGITYNWNIAGQVTTDKDPVAVIPYSDSTVRVRLIVANAEGCTDTASVETTVFAQPTASFTANNVCAGAPVQFNNTSTIAPGKGSRVNTIGSAWLFGNGEIGDGTNPLYQYPAGGNYIVKLKVTSNFGCTDTVSAPVSVYNKPTSAFTVDNICKGTNITITNSTTYPQGLDKLLYHWNFGDNSPGSDLAVPLDKKYGEARSFWVTLRVTDTVNYCVDSSTKLITIKESAKAEFISNNGCVGAPVKFTNVSVIPGGVTPLFTWDLGDNGVANVPSPEHIYVEGGKKVVKLTVNIDGCRSTAVDTVSISEAIPISFERTTTDSMKYFFTASSSAFDKYAWNFGDGSTSTKGKGDTITSNIFSRAGLYTVTLLATDANGCSSTKTDTVRVFKNVGVKDDAVAAKFSFNLYPNPFVTGARISFEVDSRKEVSVEIYDMLGRKVFVKNEGALSAGKHEISFNETNFNATAGAYLVKVKIGDEIITRQLIKQ